MLRQFDQVHLIDTRGITYLSGPPGNPASPHGFWTVVGFREGRPVLAKDSTIIVTSINNIKKVAAYNVDRVFEMQQQINNKYRKRHDRQRR